MRVSCFDIELDEHNHNLLDQAVFGSLMTRVRAREGSVDRIIRLRRRSVWPVERLPAHHGRRFRRQRLLGASAGVYRYICEPQIEEAQVGYLHDRR